MFDHTHIAEKLNKSLLFSDYLVLQAEEGISSHIQSNVAQLQIFAINGVWGSWSYDYYNQEDPQRSLKNLELFH